MKKDKDIIIRVTEELKQELTQKAKIKGLTLSSYVRMYLLEVCKNGK